MTKRVPVSAALLVLAAVALGQESTRTPTPAPRLSGGFGRPRATPAATPAHDSGQSFSDVVHAAHETRDGAPPEAGKLTINNKSLVKNSSKGKVSSSKAPVSSGKAASVTDVPPPPATSASVAADASSAGGGEAHWKQEAATARKRVADGKARVAELDAATRKLENDFYAWDDGQYRDRVIKPAWDHAKSELTDAKSDLAAAEKDLVDLPERARQAGAMPGWIRE